MARKIPVLVDEEVYYLLQELRTPRLDDVSSVIRHLLFAAAGADQRDHWRYEHELTQRVRIAEALENSVLPRQVTGGRA